MPKSSRSSFPASTVEWIASLYMAALPVTSAAPNLQIAIATLPAIAAMMTRSEPECSATIPPPLRRRYDSDPSRPHSGIGRGSDPFPTFMPASASGPVAQKRSQALGQDRIPGGNSTIAGHSYPGGHCGTWQGCSLLEGEVARHVHERLLVQHRVLSQHAVEIGAKPIRKVIRLDRTAIPARMKAAGNPVTDLDPRHPLADGFNIAGTIRKRYHAKLGRTATATFEDHQVAVIERTCPDPHQDLLWPRPGVFD